METLLKVENLTKNFGGLTAVSSINMDIKKGELIGLIGPNGAGKTTFFNLITGVYEPTEGHVTFSPGDEDHVISSKKTHQISDLGVARTFQNIRLFKDLTVLDNVKIGLHENHKSNLFQTFFRTPAFYKAEEGITKDALELLEIFNMENQAENLAKNLPYGDQRKLEIVRALATEPALLFLDEPAAGMNPQESAELNALIKRIHKEFDLTIVLIEHDMNVVMSLSDRVYVLEYGKLIAQGRPEDIQSDERVIKAYLGGG